jgi:hypothetical protein
VWSIVGNELGASTPEERDGLGIAKDEKLAASLLY